VIVDGRQYFRGWFPRMLLYIHTIFPIVSKVTEPKIFAKIN